MNLHPLSIRPVAAALLLGIATGISAQITTDGQLDAAYGRPLAIQFNPTGYGDNTNADPLAANGSELDAAHAVIRDGKLHLLLTGNLETNFNKLNIFIDSQPGGQNELANDNPDVDFNGLNNLAGLTFDTGFEADYFLAISGGGTPVEFFANYAELGNPGVGTFLGGTGSPNTGFPVTLGGVEVGIDNSNIAGVTDVTGQGFGVTTGIEFSIPLTLIGNPTGPVKVCAFITNPGRTDVSNQVLGTLENGTANLGTSSAVDFSALPSDQFFTVPWQVTNNADSGPGSLRQTIIDAPSGSFITFAPALAGQTITLGGTAMFINKALTISGFDLRPGITLDANQSSRVFYVGPTGSLTLQGLTLTGGNSVGTPASGFGGAILTEGTLLASHCLFIGNSANLDGGAVSGDCDLINCTFTGNSARNGAAVVMGNGSLHHCTVVNNQGVSETGAVYGFEGVVTIANCIVAENSPNDIWLQNGQVLFAGRNIAISTDSTLDGAGFTGPAPLTDSPALVPLGNYGGPTLSRPPFPGSPAIDGALPAAIQPPDDQRGAIRGNDPLDIGAVEYQPAIVTTASDQNDSPEGPELSLREAMAREFVSSITFDSAVFNGEPEDIIVLTHGQLVLDRSVTMDGGPDTGVTIDANGATTNHRVLHVTEAVAVAELWDIHFTGGTTPPNPELNGEFGGGILNQGNLILDGCSVFGNTTGSGAFGAPGGGIHNSGHLSMRGGSVHDNTTGIGSSGPGGDGAGISNYGSLDVRDGTRIHGNTTGEGFPGGNGGGIANFGGQFEVWDSLIEGNAANYGSGVFNTGTLSLHQSVVSENSAIHDGGGIYSSGTLTLHQSTLSGNSASLGGGIINFSTLTLNECTISGNSGTDGGGGVHNNGNLTVNQSTFSANVADEGGGIANLNTMTIHQSTITGNLSGRRGGGIENVGNFTLSNSLIAANSAVLYPDLSDATDSIDLEGFNLLSDTTGSGLSAGPNVLVAAPLLAPLGDYGGPTQTMPPLPGSPAINAAGTSNPGGTDQRGLSRFFGGALDIGAVEYQGNADLAPIWSTDWDGDGKTFGIEFALGNDPFTADPDEEGNLTTPVFNPSGHATLSFRRGDAARASTIWILQRSPDLSPGSWQEIYRYDGPAFLETKQPGTDSYFTTTITPNTTFAHVTDLSPFPGKGFYRFVAELAAP